MLEHSVQSRGVYSTWQVFVVVVVVVVVFVLLLLLLLLLHSEITIMVDWA